METYVDSRIWSALCDPVPGPEPKSGLDCEYFSGWRDNTKPHLICPNWKHIYTVWIVPCRLYSALCHSLYRKYYTVNKWAVSAAASASVYSEGAGASCSREHLIGQKIWWEVLAEVTNCKLWMLISAKCKFSHCFGAHRDTDNLQPYWY